MALYNNYGYYPQMAGTQMSVPNQIQNGGVIPAPSENYARSYPVVPGNSVTFKDENAPYMYVKTRSFNQLEDPVFEKFRLVKEDIAETAQNGSNMAQPQNPINLSDYVKKDEFDRLRKEFEAFRKDLRRETDDT